MKKVFLLLLVATLLGCSNVKRYGPHDEDKAICKENMDTITNHLSVGWVVVDSFYNTDRYYSVTNKDGSRDEFYHWILLSRISDGKDTLTIMTNPSNIEEWSGYLTSLHFLSSKDIDGIKRHNLAMKRACNDSCFMISVDDSKIMSATFRKEKPKDPERPLEDYGLKKSDL
jgi:hypothetical protein